MSDPQTAWQAWLGSLDAPRQAVALSLRAQFETLGAADGADWARSEISEDLPHLARFLLLRGLWRSPIDGWADPGALDQLPAARRLLAAGADRADLVLLARAVAYESVFATLDELDAGGDVNVSDVGVGWVVMEAGEDGSSSGRCLSGLHEELLTMDPSGRDGDDLWR
ncbi:hypothetical protein [Kitasatospora sp. NBC_01266]|uniref:hypothetical protein n=1 Tax=Kitasatospora sp. NBC_01266 TaxID=2903572 RepID=UPI002E3696B1|nr:hypothetical protein [Kitasatospora sp. NBC_01266]